jgi:hypothetical protein
MLEADTDMIFVAEYRRCNLDLPLVAVARPGFALPPALDPRIKSGDPAPVAVDLRALRRRPPGWRAAAHDRVLLGPPIASPPASRGSAPIRANTFSAAPTRVSFSWKSQIVSACGTGSRKANPTNRINDSRSLS